MDPALQRARDVAQLAVRRAALLTKTVQQSASVKGISKTDSTPVTAADFAAQAVIIAAIRSAFPHDSFLGEEDATTLREDEALRGRVFELVATVDATTTTATGESLRVPISTDEVLEAIDLGGQGQGGSRGRFWVMDPIDGTMTFLRGQQYAVALALVEDGKEVLGVLACPNLKVQNGRLSESVIDTDGLGVVLTAVKDHGATVATLSKAGLLEDESPVPLLRSPPSPASNLHMVHSVLSKSLDHGILREVAARLDSDFAGTDLWCSHMRYAAMVLGGGDFQVRVQIKGGSESYIWDHAGAQLIYTEIGGIVTDQDGKPIDFGSGRVLDNNKGFVLAEKSLHPEILQVTQDVVLSMGEI